MRTLAAQSISMGSSMAGSLTLEPMEGEDGGGGSAFWLIIFLIVNLSAHGKRQKWGQ